MKLFYKVVFIAFLGLLQCGSFAQTNEWPVRFANGHFITGNNIEKQNFTKADISSSLFGDHYFVLVQFSVLPSKDTQVKLKLAGVSLYSYLPEHTYLAAIKRNFDFATAKNYQVIAINVVPAFYKINKSVFSYSAPAKKEEEQGIAVNYYGQADKSTVVASLRQKGAVIITEKFSAGNLILIQYNRAIVDSIAALPFVTSIDLQLIKDQPVNYDSRGAHAVSGLNAWGGKNLNGKGVTIGIGDNADISTHIDFTGRLINRTPNTASYHGTHVAGTAAGGGIINPRHRGMASKAAIINQSFSDVIIYAPSYVTDYDMIATNNSYHSAPSGCPGEREYNGLSSYGDAQMMNYEELQHVFASGNDGGTTCAPYPASFGTIKSGWQCGKNILTVGALNVANNSIASYSGRGPTADGRIKPEITTDGYAVLSTTPANGYDLNYGTSMAAPGVTGALALMYERYRQTKAGNNPESALMKAIACNTAEDLGNAGPDFTFGFGMMNTRRAVEAIDSNRYFTGNIANGANATHNFTVPANTRRLKVMLYWNDPAAASNAATTLVNDIDMVLIEPSLTLHRPLVLNSTPANVNNIATEAPDHLNNVEQAVIENPAPGIYSAALNGYNIPSGTQDYVVTYEIIKNSVTVEYPYGGETWVPGETEVIRWSAYGSEANSFTIEYSVNNGNSWSVISNNVSATARLYNWVVPAVASGNALIRISRNNTSLSGQSSFGFSILGQPVVTVTNACEGAVILDWEVVTGADSYDIYQLSGDSMKVVANSLSSNYLLTGLNKNQTYWFAVAAKINTLSGRRSIAVSARPNNGQFCDLTPFSDDLKIDSILEPVSARQFFANAASATRPVKVTIKNISSFAVTGPYNVSYDYGGAVITETINTTINPGASLSYTFNGMYPVPAAGYQYTFKAWVTKTSDLNHSNDTTYKTVKYINNAAIASLPLTESFETTNAGTEFIIGELAVGGNKYLDFGTSSTRGRARAFVNTGFSHSGTNALTLDQAPYSNSSNTDSATFNYNLSLFTGKQIRFEFFYKNHGQADAPGNKVWIRGSENNTWVQAYDLFANQPALGEWKRGIINVNEVLENATPAQTLSATFQIKIGQEGFNSANSPYPIVDADDGYTFDDLLLAEAINDIGVLAINTPDKTGCGLSSSEPVSVKIKNYQNNILTNVQVSYRINNGAVVTETIPSIAANNDTDYVFIQRANFSAFSDYKLDVWAKFSSDNYASNDSILSYTFHGSPVISSYPYYQDFETTNGNFYTYGTNGTWQWGTPSKSLINKAANGNNAWTTNLNGNYSDYETSYLVTPCFNLAGLTNPVLSFSHIYEVEQDYDYAWVEYSTDGKVWTKLGNVGQGTNWYEDPNTNSWNFTDDRWHVASMDIPLTNTVARFRFVMSSDAGVTEEGIGIDDVRIHEKAVIADVVPSSAISTNVSGSNWVSFDPGDSVLIQINANGQNLGSVTVEPYLHINGVRNSNNQYYADRSYVIRSSNSFASNVGIRLYFTDEEARALLSATGCQPCGIPYDAYELGVTKYTGQFAEENGTLEDNFANYQFITPANTLIVPHGNGYYAEFTVNSFSEFWLSKDNIAPLYQVCQGSSSVTFTASPSGSTYQWQIDTGSGYTNISNGVNYSGATSATLQLNNANTAFTGYKYRAVVNGTNGKEYTLRFKNVWTGAISTDWFTAGNWSCGIVPDQYTDVVIPSSAVRYPTLTASTVIRSLKMLKDAPMIINTGVKLDVNGR
ncbi:MAG TPA: S8 family serine peptidase [Ferruginibacter sp.]|nr:S8 family serine peptidase [Ferruginibacter sp.]